MVNSKRHKQLLSRISQIESNLLPRVRLDGNYTKKESDLIRSYVLLCHAEIESYFEDIAESKVRKALSEWVSIRKKSNCLLSVMAFCVEEINWGKSTNNNKEKVDYRVNKVVSHFLNSLKSNHGIKSVNLCSILLPIGVEYNDLDQAWLNTMDNFGAKRGGFAHTSSTVQAQIDLTTERNNINNSILPGISNIDLLVKGLR